MVDKRVSAGRVRRVARDFRIAMTMTASAMALVGHQAAAEAADPQAPVVEAAAAAEPQVAATASALDEPMADEVTVTARRREESLLKTPVSITRLSGDDLVEQNVRNFADVRGRVSNLEIVPLLSGGTSFTIRGVGQTSAQVNSDAKAGFYVDDMYVARQEGNDLYFYDIESIQVLKGPQGTLFGKNTTAGAVLLTTKRPTDQFEGYMQLRAGTYARLETEGAINVPISEGIATRFSFRTQQIDGFIDHLLDDGKSGDVDNKSARLQLRADSGGFRLDLLGEYNTSGTDGGATIPVGCLNTASYVVNYNALHSVPFCTAYPVIGDPYTVYGGATLTLPTSAVITDIATGGDAGAPFVRQQGRGPYNDTDVYTINARASYDISDSLTIKSISAYRRNDASFYTPTLHAPNDIYAENDHTVTDQFTQELNIGGSLLDDRLDFLAGLYYFYQKTRFLQDTGPDWIDPLGYIYDGRLKYQSYAAYAQASFKFTPELELTVGGRYTYDEKEGSSYVFYAGNGGTYVRDGVTLSCGYFIGDFIGGIANCGGAPFTARGKNNWDGFDPKFQLSYTFSPELFAYATVAHGYNAGGFNQQIGATPPGGEYASTYSPEKLWSYEGGIKADLLQRRLQISLSGFYQDYSDIQSTVLVVVGGITTRQFATAATARQAGFEVEFSARPTPDLSIRGNASYLDQKYTSITPGALIGLDTPVNSAPKYQFSGAISYDFHVGGEGLLTPTLDVRGIGKKPACYTAGSATVPQISTCDLPAYALVGARLNFTPSPDSPWSISAWGTNLLDKVTQLGRTGYTGGMGVDRYTPGRPLEAGVELRVRF